MRMAAGGSQGFGRNVEVVPAHWGREGGGYLQAIIAAESPIPGSILRHWRVVATGINFFLQEIVAKRLEILLQLQPKPSRIAVLLNPTDAPVAETTLRDVQEAARDTALPIHILNASTNSEIDAAFAALVSERADALFVQSSNYFHS